MNDKTVLAIVAIVCLACLEIAALMCNRDGALMGVIVAAISSLFGLAIGARITTSKTDAPSTMREPTT
jgi:hypothetical protein